MATETTSIFKALAAAQAGFHSALKDTANPFFKSKYADLSAVWEACKEGLKENNLFVSQQPGFIEAAGCWAIVTKIYNEAGETIEGTTPIIASKANDPQAFGSAMTYARRYGLAATLGIVTDDDDAEGAMNRNQSQKAPAAKPAPEPNPEPATDKQKALIISLIQSHVFTEEEQAKVLDKVETYTKVQAMKVTENITKTLNERKAKEKEQATSA